MLFAATTLQGTIRGFVCVVFTAVFKLINSFD